MNFDGEITVDAPRISVFEAMRDARFLSSCIDGIRDFEEIGGKQYKAVLEAKIAYIRIKFDIDIELTLIDAPSVIEARFEGRPIGMVGRMAATSRTTLHVDGAGTRIVYAVEATIAGKLGSLGQPVLRSKAKEMERQFTERLRAAFNRVDEAVH